MRDIELRRDFERLCRKRGLSVFTTTMTGSYMGETAALFEFFKLGVDYAGGATFEQSWTEGWDD